MKHNIMDVHRMYEGPHQSQYSYECKYPCEFEANMQHPGASLKRPAEGARAHHFEEPRGYKAVDHTKHMERMDVAGHSYDPLKLKGIMGGEHGEFYNFPEGVNPKKNVERERKKMGARGIQKGGIEYGV